MRTQEIMSQLERAWMTPIDYIEDEDDEKIIMLKLKRRNLQERIDSLIEEECDEELIEELECELEEINDDLFMYMS